MLVTVEIADYDKHKGIEYLWEEDCTISVEVNHNKVVIKSNKAGLKSLARQLLTLAQDDIPIGRHFHYDEYNSLEDGSCGLIISKIED